MTITATIDGWPYSISFGGTIDIERLSTGDVAIRRVSPGEALSVELDLAELKRKRDVVHKIRAEFERWFMDRGQYPVND
jgi:hypothetical protein